jgi:hypothetical protein
MIRVVAPLAVLGLLGWEIYERIRTPYGDYGRVVEFYGGWLMLILIGGTALFFTLLRSRKQMPGTENEIPAQKD